MEEPADTERAAAEVQGTRVRRKLVQSTLFPQSNGKIDANEREEDEEEEKEEEEEEWCGSQGGRRCKKRKQNLYQNRDSKPRVSQKKVQANGKDTSKKKVGDGDPADIAKSDFFLKVSERQHQKREQKEQMHAVSDGVDDNAVSTPPAADMETSPQVNSTPKKRRMNTTPKKKAISSCSRASSRKTSADLTKDESTPQTTPNLRLEAKFIAEENSRLYAGKEIHPFFSSRKVDKRSQGIINQETEQCSFVKEGTGITFNPVHVFERFENDAVTLDWRHWTFSDTSFVHSGSGLESGGSMLHEGSVNSLPLDHFLSVSRSPPLSLCQKEIPVDPSLRKEDQKTKTVTFIHDDLSCITYDAEWQGRFCRGSCQNCLWTDKYQPKKIVQVCGNGEAVERLNEWLHLWHDKCVQTSQSAKSDDKSIAEDDFYLNQRYYDSDDVNEETALENVLLVTGPVGSGKSAAIYACAKEQGFQVIEINASDWRNGSLVKQKFGEAVESHWLQGTVVNSTPSKTKHPSKAFVTFKGSDNDVDFIPLSDEEDTGCASAGLMESFCSDTITNNQNKFKTLILFEDVDATLYEDSGFISTIHQLAKTAKRPMILTSNSENPLLPSNLDRLHLRFTVPLLEELIGLANVVCAAENARIDSSMIELCVELCQRDIRKTIMNLQFWCQGQNFKTGTEVSARSPLSFDLDASHRVLPKIVSWGYPSSLSELVEEEIAKSLMMMGENHNPMVIDNEEELNDINLQDGSSTPNSKQDNIEAKKEALLSLHCSVEDDETLATSWDTNCNFYSNLDSPVEDTQPGVRRKFNAVIFSDSEEDYFTDRKPVAMRRMLDDSDDETPDVKIITPSSLSERWCSALSTELLNQFEGEKFGEDFCQHIETMNCSHINDTKPVDRPSVHCSYKNETSKSVDISCVPESSIVAETEFDDQTDLSCRTVSYDHASCREVVDSLRNDPPSGLMSMEGPECYKSLPVLDEIDEILISGCPISINREVVGNSHVDSLIDVPIEYQVLDECSRVDFIRRFKSSEKLTSHRRINSIQDTWRKLRDRKMDLRQYVNPQEKDALKVMKVTYGLSNLISDADLLLNDCQPLLPDFLDPSMIPFDKPQSYSWHDDQLHMSSIFAEHGICFYAEEAAALEPKVGSIDRVDLALEMLTSSTNPMVLGKLVNQERKRIDSPEMRLPGSCVPLRSKLNPCLIDVLKCVVPSKSYFSLQGDAGYEYLSSLSQISRLQTSLLPESLDNRKQRRTRLARHYLSSGTFPLTSEHISLLGAYNYYQKASSSQSSGANFR